MASRHDEPDHKLNQPPVPAARTEDPPDPNRVKTVGEEQLERSNANVADAIADAESKHSNDNASAHERVKPAIEPHGHKKG